MNPADTHRWSGPDALFDLLQPIEDLILLPGNPRQGDVGAISQSLERFGQQKPIVVNSDKVILAGNHTYLAASALGWTHVAAVSSELEGREQAGFALADNRLSDLASYDNDALLMMISTSEDLIGTGYDPDDVDYLMRQQAAWEGNLLDPSESAEIARLLGVGDWDETEVFKQYPKILIHFPDQETLDQFVDEFPIVHGRGGKTYWYPDRPEDHPISQGRGAKSPSYEDVPVRPATRK